MGKLEVAFYKYYDPGYSRDIYYALVDCRCFLLDCRLQLKAKGVLLEDSVKVPFSEVRKHFGNKGIDIVKEALGVWG